MGVTVVGPSTEQMGRSIGEWVKAETFKTAIDVLSQEVRRGFDNQPEVITDGVLRRDPAQVKPFGKIEFVARLDLWEVIQWVMAELFRRSPVKTGDYRQSHVLLINGNEVKGNLRAALQKVKAGDKVQVVNWQPYARKLEGATANKKTGRGKRKPSSRQAPGGIYRPVLRALLQRYSKTIFADYKLVNLNRGVKVWGDQGGGYNRAGVKRHVKRVQRDQVYPAIEIWIRPSQAQVH